MLTIDEIRWLQASEAILQSPAEDPGDDKPNKSESCAIPNANLSLAQPSPNTRAKPHSLLMPPTPNPSAAAKPSTATSVLADTPSSFEEQSVSTTPNPTLSAQSRIQPPSLHRNRTWNKNRHVHIGSGRKDDLSSSGSPSMPTTLQSPPTPSTSSNPISASSIPRSPVAHSRLPVSRPLPSQRTEWIYRQPKIRSPPSLSVSTPSSSPSTSAPKHVSPPSPSRIPLRTRTRSTTRMKPRPRPQTGFHSHVANIPANIPASPAKKPVHTTLPARPSPAPKTAPPQATNKAFWSSLLSRKSDAVKRSISDSTMPGSSSLESLDIAKEKSGTASSSLSSLLSLEPSRPTYQKKHDKEAEMGKEPKKAAKHPSQTSSSSLSSLSTSAPQIPEAINMTGSVGKGAGLTRLVALAPSHSTTSTGSPPRTRSSSASSNSSSSTSRSVSTAATSTSAVSSSSPTCPVSTSTKPSHSPVVPVSMSPSKSILSRTSSTASSSRPLHRVVPFTIDGGGTPSSSKSVTFVDVPTVHYATSYTYSDGESESDRTATSGAPNISGEVRPDTSADQAARKAGNGAQGGKQGQVTGARWSGNDLKRSGGSLGYWHDQGVDVEAMDMTIKEEDEDVEAMHSETSNAYLQGPLHSPTYGAHQRQRSNPTSLKKTDIDGGAVGLKRLMSLTRKPGDSPRKAEMRVTGDVRLNISGPFALGSLPSASSLPLTPPSPSFLPRPLSPYSRSTPHTGRSSSSSTASLRSYSSSTKHNTPSRSAGGRAAHHKSYSYSGRAPIPFAPVVPSSATTTSSYNTTRSHGFYPSSLRAAPSLESFKSTAGRSVRSLGSAKSTTRTQGFRAWLAKVAEGVGIGGGIGDDEY